MFWTYYIALAPFTALQSVNQSVHHIMMAVDSGKYSPGFIGPAFDTADRGMLINRPKAGWFVRLCAEMVCSWFAHAY